MAKPAYICVETVSSHSLDRVIRHQVFVDEHRLEPRPRARRQARQHAVGAGLEAADRVAVVEVGAAGEALRFALPFLCVLDDLLRALRHAQAGDVVGVASLSLRLAIIALEAVLAMLAQLVVGAACGRSGRRSDQYRERRLSRFDRALG
jgi:hypothetical protein